jgi:hypothetical protein
MSIAFDAHVNLDKHDPAMAAARSVEQSQRLLNPSSRLYFEPGPAATDAPWLKPNYNAWISNANESIKLDKWEDWRLKPMPQTSEIVVQLSEPPEGKTWKNFRDWIRPFVAFHLEQGRSVALNPQDMIDAGMCVEHIAPEQFA